MVLYPCLYRFPTLWRIFILCVCEILLVHVLTVARGRALFFSPGVSFFQTVFATTSPNLARSTLAPSCATPLADPVALPF